MMDKKIVIINAGSSSVKFKVFLQKNDNVIASGLCERIGIDGNFKIKYLNKNHMVEFEKQISMPNHEKAIDIILKQFKEKNIINDFKEITGIGHRVVQVGTVYNDSTLIDAKCIKTIEKYTKLAPLHNPPELKVINIFKKKLPKVKNVAAFDTSFHTTIPEINHVYPISKEIAKKYEIRRYGYHGVSYKYITKKMQEILNKKSVNLIVCHIGNGASICAIKNSKSFDTSMGLTPLEGLMMGTRCGSIDPSIATYLGRMGLSNQEIDDIFNKKSGLYGLTGSADLRDAYKLADKKNKQAIFTIQLYINKITDYIVRYANELEGKIDAIVFTAGVGENQMNVVGRSLNNIKLFKIDIDQKKVNEQYADYKKITTSKSKYPAFVVRTDEELMIEQDVKRLTK